MTTTRGTARHDMTRVPRSNPPRKIFFMRPATSRRVTIVLTLLAALVTIVSGMAYISVHHHNPNVPRAVQAVNHIPSARQVAAQLNCGKFKDHGSAAGGMVIDSGSCWIGSKKYGVDTFNSPNARDTWLKTTEDYFGIRPKWETDTAVIYPSVSKTS